MSLAAILVIFSLTIGLESRAPCRNEVKRPLRNEGSPMAKAKPCMVARDPRSEEICSQSLRYLVNPVNTDERKEVEIPAGNSGRFASRPDVGYLQASRQKNAPMAAGNSWREEQLQTHRDERYYSNSICMRRPVRGVSKPEFQNMRYRNHQYMTKIFSSCKRSWECQQATQLSRCKHTDRMS